MKVIFHQHIGVNGDVKLFGVVIQQIQQRLVVQPGSKNRLAVVTALDDVVRVARDGEAGEAGHGEQSGYLHHGNWNLTPI